MSLTDRVPCYVLVRRSSIQQLNAGPQGPVKPSPNYKVATAHNMMKSAEKTRAPTADCGNADFSFAKYSTTTKARERSMQTAESSRASSQGRGLASPICDPITNTKLRAVGVIHGSFHKTCFQPAEVSSAQDLGRDSDQLKLQTVRSGSVFMATALLSKVKETEVRKPRGGRFVMGNLRMRNGSATVTLVKPTAESPKVAPHPGDKDIPLVTNSSGLLESRLSASFDNPALSKTSIHEAMEGLGQVFQNPKDQKLYLKRSDSMASRSSRLLY